MNERLARQLWVVPLAFVLAIVTFLLIRPPWRPRRVNIGPVASMSVHMNVRPRGIMEGKGHAVHVEGREHLPCTACHEVRAERFDRPDAAKCRSCHQKQVALHTAKNAEQARECITCHSFLPHDGEQREPWRCMECHGETEPGALGATALVLAARKIDVHGGIPCGDCHRPHTEPATSPTACVGCHKGDKAPKHPVALKADAKPCLDCHRAHEKQNPAADPCFTCHRSQKPIVAASATFAWGHPRCTSCHGSHEGGGKAGTKGCKTCHAAQHTVAEEKGGSHAACGSCHTTHAVKAGSAGCIRCHSKAHANDPTDFARGCIGCHSVHGGKKTATKTTLTALGTGTCSSKGCHDKAKSDNAFHAGGLDCRSCHAPHGSTSQTAKACNGCHKSQATNAAGNVGHADCNKCHAPHTPGSKPSCASCHAKESSSAPKGHAACNTCHETHGGAVGKTCDDCHKAKKSAPHGSTKGGCTSCHRAHGPNGVASPPSCGTCHATGKLPALHAQKAHQACGTCHGGHSAPKADRASCTSCHADRMNHEPSAKKCSGCHAFGGGP